MPESGSNANALPSSSVHSGSGSDDLMALLQESDESDEGADPQGFPSADCGFEEACATSSNTAVLCKIGGEPHSEDEGSEDERLARQVVAEMLRGDSADELPPPRVPPLGGQQSSPKRQRSSYGAATAKLPKPQLRTVDGRTASKQQKQLRARTSLSDISASAATMATAVPDGTQCEHPVVIRGMCSTCGQLGGPVAPPNKGHLILKHLGRGTWVSSAEARRLADRDLRRLLKARKLLLVLDLDHTLLNSCRHVDVASRGEVTLLASFLHRQCAISARATSAAPATSATPITSAIPATSTAPAISSTPATSAAPATSATDSQSFSQKVPNGQTKRKQEVGQTGEFGQKDGIDQIGPDGGILIAEGDGPHADGPVDRGPRDMTAVHQALPSPSVVPDRLSLVPEDSQTIRQSDTQHSKTLGGVQCGDALPPSLTTDGSATSAASTPEQTSTMACTADVASRAEMAEPLMEAQREHPVHSKANVVVCDQGNLAQVSSSSPATTAPEQRCSGPALDETQPGSQCHAQPTLYHLTQMPEGLHVSHRPDSFQAEPPQMWTKLRPGVRDFLAAAAKLFELHICTMGDRQYAEQMAGLLDPECRFFAERIISSEDTTQHHVKDLDVMLGSSSAAVVIDDTEGVWPLALRGNLITAPRYIWFPTDHQRFRVAGEPLLTAGTDEEPSDGLGRLMQVMTRVHSTFYAAANPSSQDVRLLLAAERRQLLAGCVLAFSGIFPQSALPASTAIGALATALGAECQSIISRDTTHLVAASAATDKASQARRQCIAVVGPAWLIDSGLRWRKQREADYPVSRASLASGKAPLVVSDSCAPSAVAMNPFVGQQVRSLRVEKEQQSDAEVALFAAGGGGVPQ